MTKSKKSVREIQIKELSPSELKVIIGGWTNIPKRPGSGGDCPDK